jgi:Domain of unknown function (DUF4157)
VTGVQTRDAMVEPKRPREQGPERRPEETRETFPGRAAHPLLSLQRSHGNRHVQRLVALARRAAEQAGAGLLDPEVDSSIQRARGGGRALDGTTRERMESAFGADFGGVRIHTGAEADRLNRAVSARAFTTGSDVFFRHGEYRPGSSAGHELLAHELTHVVQQNGAPVQAKLTLGPVDDPAEREADAVAREVVQRTAAPVPAPPARDEKRAAGSANLLRRKPAGGGEERDAKKTYRIKIPAGVTTRLQFLRYAEVQIFGRVVDHKWDLSKAPATIGEPAKHVGQPVNFWVRPSLLAAYGVSEAGPGGKAETDETFGDLSTEDKAAVNAEADERYYASTRDEPGSKIKPGETGKAVVWNSLKDQVLADRKKLEKLPDTIKAMIGPADLTLENSRILAQVGDALAQLSESELKAFFVLRQDGAVLSPADYPRLLSIARKLAALSPQARKDYLGRVNASTTSLAELERSIDRYAEFRVEREKQFQEHEDAAKPLLGAEDVYTAYRGYEALRKNVALARSLKGSAKDKASAEDSYLYLQERLRESETELLAALKHKGFDSIPEFAAKLETYRIAFRTQAVNFALDVLDRYDHMLFAERRRLQQGAAAGIAQGIAASQAPQQYKEYHKQKSTAQLLLLSRDPEGFDTSWVEPYTKARSAAAAAKSQAQKEVIRGAGDHPLIAERGIDLEKLARLDTAGVESYLTQEINERSVKVQTARQEFKEDPDRVFKLKDLVAATQKLLAIDPSTIYGRTISDYISDESGKHFLSQIALGILAIALTFLVPGGGWLAAAALVAQAGISTYQAYTAYQEYQEQERDYALGFLSEEPSLFWVGVAIAGAALDLGVATTALVKQSATALKALKGPLLEFSKDDNLPKLLAQIEAVQGLEAKVKVALAREAEASLAAKAAFKEALSIASRSNMIAGAVDPGLIRQLFRGLYYAVIRGINTFTKLSAEARILEITGDITRLSGAERAELEAAFEEVKQIVSAGQAKGMDEKSLLGFVDRWALNRGKPGFQAKLAEDIRRWKPLTADQRRALDALEAQKRAVATLYDQKTAAEEELAALRAQPDRTPEDVAEIRELEKEIRSLDPQALPGAKPGAGRGKIAEAEATLATREVEAARSNLSLYDRLRSAVPSEAAKNRVLKGVAADQVGPLKTPPAGLHPDHIVSVREIADLDGFADLPWKDQKAIADGYFTASPEIPKNLIAMDASANLSKSDRTWRSWKQAGTFYEQSTIDAMAKREADIRALIEADIKERLAKLAAGTP